ncbi:MAG: hypothetical protein H6747_12690 [Deltaproteobacteria bacterium]|nr:hypothetical protein [Deltaproteobacteria bacterium]
MKLRRIAPIVPLTHVALLLSGCSALFPEPVGISAGADASIDSGGAIAVQDAGESTVDAEPADVTADVGGPDCNLGACPLPAPCHLAACSEGACIEVPATGGSCDDGDLCTATGRCEDGVCSAGGPRNWLSVLGNGGGGRLSALVADAGGGIWAAGSSLATKGGQGYDAWLVRLDADGRQVGSVELGQDGSDDLVALVRTVDGGIAAVGYGGKTGRIVKVKGDGALVWSQDASQTNARYDALAAVGAARLVAAGMSSLSTQSGGALVDAFEPAGALAWTFERKVAGKRVAATKVAAFGSKSALAGQPVVLGYDRTFPPGGSGSELYELWLIALDATGKQVWKADLASGSSLAAAGLAARIDGSFVVLTDQVGAQLVLDVVDAKGKVTPLGKLPSGSISTSSDLALGSADQIFVLRDDTKAPAQLMQLDATGAVIAARALTTPTGTRARVFGLRALGGSAVGLVGDLMRTTTSASSTSWRAFARRVDLGPAPGCSETDACLGDTHGCAEPPACTTAYCDAVSGCQTLALPPAVCTP